MVRKKMDVFCGGETFWNTSITWSDDISYPDFSECFQNSVLIWISSAVILLSLPVYLPYLLRKSRQPLPRTWKYISKLCITVLQLVIVIAEILFGAVNISKNPETFWPSYLLGHSTEAVTLLIVILYLELERRKGVLSSGVMFSYWLLVAVTYIVPFYRKIILKEYETFLLRFVFFKIYYGLTIAQLILSCLAEKLPSRDHKDPWPEDGASFLSRIIFHWVQRLVSQGFKKTLTEEDMHSLNPRDSSRVIFHRFDTVWRHVRDRVSNVHRKHVKDGGGKPETPVTLPLLDVHSNEARSEATVVEKRSTPGTVSLLAVLWKTFWFEMLGSQVMKLVDDVLFFVSPFLLRLLIDFASDTAKPSWQGFVLTGAFPLVIMMKSLLFHGWLWRMFGTGLRVRSVLVGAIFRKALRLNNRARTESTTGEIVNLMSVDVEHIKEFVTFSSFLWSSVVLITGSLVYLYYTVGYAMFAGSAVLLLMMPVNAVVVNKVMKLQNKMMEKKDQRIKLMTEILNGIKILKLYAWEMAFGEKVTEIRRQELKLLLNQAIIRALLTYSWTIAPFVVGFITYATYIYTQPEHRIDPQTAFVAMSLFNILKFAIIDGPYVLMEMTNAYVSLKRIDKFLSSPDLNITNVMKTSLDASEIKIEEGTFTWNPEFGPCLSDISLDVPKGSLVAVVGAVGSGKSSLISAMLGEMEKVRGQVYVQGSTAYVPQQAWIQNTSLRDNILFGNQLDRSRYQKVVDACALRSDIEMLAAKDMTEIGEKGINLSGGQRQRISLARAVYFDSDTYLLDDPLSAVDSHVGKHIFEQVIGDQGMLANKTRIFVTHGIQWLPKADCIVVLSQGRISEIGSYDQLLDHDGDFSKFLRTYLTSNEEEEEDEDDEVKVLKKVALERLMSRESDKSDEDSTLRDKGHTTRRRTFSRSISEKLVPIAEQKVYHQMSVQSDAAKLIEEEELQSGSVKWSVVKSYFRAVGYRYAALLFLSYGMYQVLAVYSTIWLTDWTSDPSLQNLTLWPADSEERRDKNDLYVGVYAGLGIAQAFVLILYLILQSKRLLHAAKCLQHNMLTSILRAPMSFFDTTPVGRILNRFSQDVESIDRHIPRSFEELINCLFMVISILIVISYSTPIFIVVVIPVSIVYIITQRYYISTSRQLRRLESKTRSPIYNNFSESLTGVSVIRAFGVQQRFIDSSEKRVDHNQVFAYTSIAANRWLGVRLEAIGAVIIFAASLFAVLDRGSISGAIAGLSVSYALQVTGYLNWLVRMISEMETNIVGVERVQQYTDIKQEAPAHLEHRPSAGWPNPGMVEFNNFSVRYRDNLDLVLKDINFTIKPLEKVGIVGRTGAGKSSLTVSLFRLLEAASGHISIDSENISRLGLTDLRSRLTILPQEPVLFSGTLRLNLDPLDAYKDQDIWSALEHAHLKGFVDTLPGQLTYEVGEGGQNLSVGQRQLMCLARSLLRKTKILILDEATAAVDLETDQLIQETISKEFADCTVLTIAHRLNTILDYDKILVLGNGKVQEFDAPSALLSNSDSTFYAMAKDAGLV